MKSTRFIALALAILTASSLFACGNNSDSTTAAAGTSKAPVSSNAPTGTVGGDTTTAAGDTTDGGDTTTEETPATTAPTVEAEVPATGIDAAGMLTGTSLHSVVTDVAVSGFTAYGATEGIENLFNGTTTGDKMGGNVSGDVEITWKTSVPSTVSQYIVYTANDSADFGRLPFAWEFSGSNDGSTWTTLDKVDASGVTKSNNAPFGYTVDTPAAYTDYKFVITACSSDGVAAGATELQMNEIVLIGEAEGVTKEAETPATGDDLTALLEGATDITANVDINSVSASGITLWGDGAATNLFDGDTTGTKLGGNGSEPEIVINFETPDKFTCVSHYVVYTGADSGTYGRTPQSWVLYGSANGTVWNIIDVVSNSGMPNVDATGYGFDVSTNTLNCKYYKLVITGALARNDLNGEETLSTPGANFDLQFNELQLYGTAIG